jgi:hypothetical protein
MWNGIIQQIHLRDEGGTSMNITPLDPPDFDGDEAIEVLRVWLARAPESEACHKLVLLPEINEDAAAWGLMLVDIARQVANAYATETEPENQNNMYSAVLSRIKAGFDAEWENR